MTFAWRNALEGGLVAAAAAAFSILPPLITDGKLSWAEGGTVFVTFGSVFFAYLKTHAPIPENTQK